MRRKILLLLIIALIPFTFSHHTAYAQEKDVEESLSEEIEELINSIDLNAFEEYLREIPKILVGGTSLKSNLLSLIKGETKIDFKGITDYVLALLFSGVKQKLPTFTAIFALLIICAVVNSIKPDKLGGGIYEIVRFACFSVIVTVVVTVCYSLTVQAKTAIEKTGKAVQSVFPIMLALMTATGNSSSVAVYSPTVLFMSDFIVIIVNKIIFPIILGMLAICVISNVCKTVKLNGLLNFSSSTLKWIIGLIATVFSLFLTVRGLNSGVYDGISIRALKYTVNSSVPIVGGILRDGLDLILASGVLVKNALGGVAILIIFGIVIQPIIEIACVSLALKLVTAVLEPINDTQTTGFINSVTSVINFAIATVIIVALMYVVVIILAICSSQYIF